MVKTNGTFKLSKSSKRMMIDAEVAEIKAKMAKISKPKNEAKVS